MEFQQVLELINAVSESQITTVQYEEENQKIMISKNELRESDVPGAQIESQVESKVEAQTSASKGNIVTCPLVGMFYSAPSEDAEPFVKVGDLVKKGQTLAIVEAMKLMNEIECDFDGEVVEILVDNAQGVAYGQPLFVIR